MTVLWSWQGLLTDSRSITFLAERAILDVWESSKYKSVGINTNLHCNISRQNWQMLPVSQSYDNRSMLLL